MAGMGIPKLNLGYPPGTVRWHFVVPQTFSNVQQLSKRFLSLHWLRGLRCRNIPGEESSPLLGSPSLLPLSSRFSFCLVRVQERTVRADPEGADADTEFPRHGGAGG